MRNRKLITLAIAPIFAVGLAACTVEETREGEAPEFHVEEGQTPAYEVEPADVEIREDTVTVPEVEINPRDDDRDATGTSY